MNLEMDTDNHRVFISASFDEVKSKLDPAFSYLIFKGAPVSGKDERIRDIKNNIACFQKGVSEEVVYHDESSGEYFWVIKIDSEIRDDCIQEFVDLNLAKEMTIYFFSNSPER